MKNIVVVVCLLLSISAFAQSSVGVETGVLSSKSRGDTFIENGKRLTTFSPGLFYEYKFSERLAIKSVFSLQNRGTTFVFDNSNFVDPFGDGGQFIEGPVEDKSDRNYFVINPMIKYRTSGVVKFFANAGPFYGISTKNNHPGDFGITSGIGIEKNLGLFEFSLEARNSLGLSNLNRDGSLNLIPERKTNTYQLLLGAAYKFN